MCRLFKAYNYAIIKCNIKQSYDIINKQVFRCKSVININHQISTLKCISNLNQKHNTIFYILIKAHIFRLRILSQSHFWLDVTRMCIYATYPAYTFIEDTDKWYDICN